MSVQTLPFGPRPNTPALSTVRCPPVFARMLAAAAKLGAKVPSAREFAVYVISDPTKRLSEEVVLVPHSRGIRVHMMAQGQRGKVVFDWRFGSIRAMTRDSGLPDEMDEFRIEVGASAGGASRLFVFEIDDADVVIRAINDERRRASVAVTKNLGLDEEAIVKAQASAGAKAGWKKARSAGRMMGILGAAAAKASKRELVSEEKVFDWDFVIVIQAGSGMKLQGKQSGYTMQHFANTMVGLRQEKIKGTGSRANTKVEFVDTSSRILRTNRCYMSSDGQRMHRTASGLSLDDADKAIAEEASETRKSELRAEKIDAMRQYMFAEFEAETGSTGACSADAFANLVAKALVRRLLQACGLSTKMKYSMDGDEVFVTVRADERDLAVQADRSNYKLQACNQPFMKGRKVPKMRSAHVQTAMEMLQERADDSELPMLDPGMFRRGWQDDILHHLEREGHDEEGDIKEDVTYFAPYCDYEADDGKEHLQVLFRHYTNRMHEQSKYQAAGLQRSAPAVPASR